jgi:hypothetical protein
MRTHGKIRLARWTLFHFFIIEVLESCSHYLLVGISLLQLMSDENQIKGVPTYNCFGGIG